MRSLVHETFFLLGTDVDGLAAADQGVDVIPDGMRKQVAGPNVLDVHPL